MPEARAALIAAYMERRPDLLRFFSLRLRSEAAAEDVVQDIYLRISATPPEAEVRNPGGYLFRLGSNLMLDRLRSERRAAARDRDWRDSHRTVSGVEEVVEDAPADAVVAARQRLAAVVDVLKDLPPLTQQVFRMHKFEERSHAEVAAALGISRSAVEKHVMLVLRRLAERLA
ncbi:MAG: RNA polymerase sigma factor [Phenylobacterium sp.]|uniref:RNA polymerase sigma factor n=1 Tax=Phenylobacterium sp. TaxID=1871053 RepID=UPI001A4C1923|nr:RNA polymerase sigma factor [Phenylobacterium sp.]MBL8554248.1 RNA polymerase sigma factor [Phenylobacterium sp.]